VKKKLRKKSALGNSLIKAIPLSVALTLFASGTAFGGASSSMLDGWLAVDDGDGIKKFNIEWLDRDDEYRAEVFAALKQAWETRNAVYFNAAGEDGIFTDFSTNARFGMSRDGALAVGIQTDGTDWAIWPYVV
jgi:hypothetical protein